MVETGDVPTTVNHVAARWNADLVVMGRGQLSTKAYGVLRGSPCPVVTL